MAQTAENTENNTPIQDPEELNGKIIKQVEFYFGDVNLLRDTFLQNEIAKNDGWVDVDVLLRFNRLKQLTTDPEIVLKALEASKNDLLVVDKEKKSVRRSESRPLPESKDGSRGVAILNPQTVYVKGFPDDSTLDSVLAWFERTGFPADGVYLRRNMKTGEFKGSVFATMPSREVAMKFVAEAPKKWVAKEGEKTEGEGQEMTAMMKEDYHVKKAQERVQKRQEQKKRQNDIYEEKKKKAVDDQLGKMSEEMTKGAVLKVLNVPEGIMETALRSFWSKFARVAWVDFTEDKKGAFVRFEETDTAKKAWDAAKQAHPCADDESSVMMEDKPLKFGNILEGEEEETYWKGVFARKAERRVAMQASKRGRGRGKMGYRGNKRGAGDDGDHADNDSKRMKEGKNNKKELEMDDSDTSDENGGEN